MGIAYTPEEEEFMARVAPVCDSWEELAAAINAEFKTMRSAQALYRACRNRRLTIRNPDALVPTRVRAKTSEMKERMAWCRREARRVDSWAELSRRYQRKFGVEAGPGNLARLCRKNGIDVYLRHRINHPGGKTQEQLCETCENAVPKRDGSRGCNWSRRLQPVPGWQTEKGGADFYIVGCPEYIQEENL